MVMERKWPGGDVERRVGGDGEGTVDGDGDRRNSGW